jgi:hypothetical protein
MKAVEKVEAHIADAVKKGDGRQALALGGTFFEPTVLTDVTDRHGDNERGDLRPGRAALPFQDRHSKRSSIR